MSGSFTAEQIAVLLRPIRPNRVAKRDGQSNVEAYEIRAHLTRIFGFGRWDEIAVSSRLLYEEPVVLKNGKDGWKVAYSADRCIRVRDQDGFEVCEHHGSAVGEAQMPDFKRGDCHDFALKKAQSQALKRAAINLGDQFGLSLYRKGSTDALIGKVVGFETVGETTTVMHEPDVIDDYDPDIGDTDAVDEPAPELDAVDHLRDHIAGPEPEQLPLGTTSAETFLASPAQIRKMQTMFGIMGVKEREKKIAYLCKHAGRTVESSKDLTVDEAIKVINQMEQETTPS